MRYRILAIFFMAILTSSCAHDKKRLAQIDEYKNPTKSPGTLDVDLDAAHPIELKLIIHPDERVEITEIDGEEPSEVSPMSTNEIIARIEEEKGEFQGAVQVRSFSVVTHQGSVSFIPKDKPKIAFATAQCRRPKHKHTTSGGLEICHRH